jgi:hypothetical protein
MFGHRYFGAAYYGPRYFGDGGSGIVIPPEPEPTPVVVSGGSGGGGMFGRHERPPPYLYRRSRQKKLDEERIEELLQDLEPVVLGPPATLAQPELNPFEVTALRKEWLRRVEIIEDNIDLLEEAIVILYEVRHG